MKGRMIEDSVIQAVIQYYDSTRSFNRTSEALRENEGKSVSPALVKRILITYGRYSDEVTEKAGALLKEGKSIRVICEELKLSRSTVINNLPYHNGITPGNSRLVNNAADKSTIVHEAGEHSVTLNGISSDSLWQAITSHQGETFHTVKNLPFTYEVRGGELFTDRRDRSITKSTFEAAFKKLAANPGTITGPKKLNVYGGPYVWAVLKGIGVISEGSEKDTSK